MVIASSRQMVLRAPELEHDLLRDPSLGFEPAESNFVRCLEHGLPWPLDRWHFHDEYELHLISTGQGQAFVGDYIGRFAPGYLALVGPRLPHNWVSRGLLEGEVVANSHQVIQFLDAPLKKGIEIFPELSEVVALLERARYGVEFLGISDPVRESFYRIRDTRGLIRLSRFIDLLRQLMSCKDIRLLSSLPMQSNETDYSVSRINKVLNYISNNYIYDISLDKAAELAGMVGGSFSRYFRRVTGNSFTEFVTRLRVAKACELLSKSDELVGDICYKVGFNNVANFNRRFLDAKDMTPTEYRRQAISLARCSENVVGIKCLSNGSTRGK